MLDQRHFRNGYRINRYPEQNEWRQKAEKQFGELVEIDFFHKRHPYLESTYKDNL
jgi:hypothetical protein